VRGVQGLLVATCRGEGALVASRRWQDGVGGECMHYSEHLRGAGEVDDKVGGGPGPAGPSPRRQVRFFSFFSVCLIFPFFNSFSVICLACY
jgi:hypothetical protein